jgi:hypothetical protein
MQFVVLPRPGIKGVLPESKSEEKTLLGAPQFGQHAIKVRPFTLLLAKLDCYGSTALYNDS